jgi:hypothetical protein
MNKQFHRFARGFHGRKWFSPCLAILILFVFCPALLQSVCGQTAASLAFSDPANTLPAPAWAVGQASREPNLDVFPAFQKPPPGFGVVPFYWWLGDPLTRARLGWELDQLSGMGICGLQINYAHTDKGGHSYGLTIPSDPPLFSEEWWQLVGWFMREGKQRGMAVSLSDYTLGAGQGWCVDEMLRANPDLGGMRLRLVKGAAPADALVSADVPGEGGQPQKVSVCVEKVPFSYDPLNPQSGAQYAKHFFGKFEDHFPGEGGKGLNFFFSDELTFGVNGRLWTPRFAEEFKRRKGYDLVPELPALFMDTGPRTPKVRLDYSDVMVALTEEGFWKPIFDWHQQRGMTMGCDHGGRGRDVTEFGDYFRTQRWNQGPGCDQPSLGRNLIKTKVASSIAHLYQRPRVWLEGYYGSGWGTTSAGLVDATFANFVMGHNLLSFHGLYYSTHGGWWEWAPPCNGFRMPYWPQMRGFMDCVQRLSYLLTQGDHRCDVAILYPVAPMEAGLGGAEAVQAAFRTSEQIYARGVDFDFMDFESLARATVSGGELRVSGEVYRVLVLPAMRAVRHSTLQKALEFQRAGGIVLAVGALPEVSDRLGRNDPEVEVIVKELFPNGPVDDVLARLPGRDFERLDPLPGQGKGGGYVLHRKLGGRDLYAVYDLPQATVCRFRATGRVELWDPWTGQVRPLPVRSQRDGFTELALPLTEKEINLIVFSPGQPEIVRPEPEPVPTVVKLDGPWEFELKPTLDNRWGDYHWPPTPTLIGAEARQMEYTEGDPTNGPWRRVTATFGPQFWKLGPVGKLADEATLKPDGQWKSCEFSWRWGVENDPGHQGYHGLKEEVPDEFLTFGKARFTGTGTTYEPEGAGGSYYLWTTVAASRDQTAHAVTGALKPAKVWLNGSAVTGSQLALKAGANPLLLRYDKPGRTFFVVSTSPEPSVAAAEALPPEACWIWYPNDKSTANLWFWKGFDLTSVASPARLRITCDNGYTVLVNGQSLGSGSQWQSVQEYDLANVLRPGRNEILVRARNDGSDAGLIAEVTMGTLRMVTDTTWQCAKTEAGERVNAEKVAGFADSLWYKHPQGPPRLEVVTPEDKPRLQVSPLAMRWWNNPKVLPFDVRASEKTPAGWYRFMSPPGLQALNIPVRGQVQVWVNGQSVAVKEGRAVVSGPSAGSVPVLLRIGHERGSYGGAALTGPIRLECVPGVIELGDWARIDGLLSYSGSAWYRKTVIVPEARRVLLELGNVAVTAEVRVNGRLVGTRVSPPWQFDLTAAVKPGENRIEVLVCNTLANHYTTIPTRYRGATTSGLLGPVTLQCQTR